MSVIFTSPSGHRMKISKGLFGRTGSCSARGKFNGSGLSTRKVKRIIKKWLKGERGIIYTIRKAHGNWTVNLQAERILIGCKDYKKEDILFMLPFLF